MPRLMEARRKKVSRMRKIKKRFAGGGGGGEEEEKEDACEFIHYEAAL